MHDLAFELVERGEVSKARPLLRAAGQRVADTEMVHLQHRIARTAGRIGP